MTQQRTWARVVLFVDGAADRTELLSGTIDEGPDVDGNVTMVVSELRGSESVCVQVPIRAFSKRIRGQLRRGGVTCLRSRNHFKIRREFEGGKLYMRVDRWKSQQMPVKISIPWLD